MSKQERTRCVCACGCPFLADLLPLFGGVRPIYDPICPECSEARERGVRPHVGPTKVGRIEFYRPSYSAHGLKFRSTIDL